VNCLNLGKLHRAVLSGYHGGIKSVDSRAFTLEAHVPFQVSPSEICGGRSGTGGTGFFFFLNPSVFPCQYHSTSTPEPHIIAVTRTISTVDDLVQ